MITTIDEETKEVVVRDGAQEHRYPIASAEAFEATSRAWLRVGWDTKYVYSFTWLGRPIIQLPDDLIRVQEMLYSVRPDVLIETGVAHGGSLMFYASLFKLMGHGRVIGVDIEVRPHNRKAIEAHELAPMITLIEGSSAEPKVAARVKSLIKEGERAFVVLDSNHTYDHVLAELELYGPLVGVGSYIIATDGIKEWIAGARYTEPDWPTNNPHQAALEFVRRHPEFIIEEPKWHFNEGLVNRRVTYWYNGIIRRLR
jgi:cephalosporin hydroxylase